MAAALAGLGLEGENRHIRIVVLGIVSIPEETPLSQGASLVRAYRTMLRYVPQQGSALDRIEVQTEVRVAREIWQGIVDQVVEEQGDLLLLHWKGNTQTPGQVYGATIDALLNDPPCDMVLARFNNTLPEIKNILMPVRGGSYSHLALSLASNLAEVWKANITVMHSLEQPDNLSGPSPSGEEETEAGEEEIAELQSLLAELPPGARLVTFRGQPVNSIVREAQSHDLIVLGASEIKERKGGPGERVVTSRVAERIAANTQRPLLVVKTRKPFELTRPQPGFRPASPNREPALEELVDRWFAENTFHYREFRTMSSLTLLKERNKLSISLVLPVYGQIQPITLAEMVRRAWFALMRDCALVDEILICAPDNRLDQNEIAAFYHHPGPSRDQPQPEEVIYYSPAEGNRSSRLAGVEYGPGEALWHALSRARGDLVVWADPTMMNFEARLIYGLIGPLLTYPEFQLATGFFSHTDEHDPDQSSPVFNELVEMSLRPLMGGFFPQLAGIINPLCSIGAARRDLLERMPIFTGPAFTSGLLVDTLAHSGLMSMAQVDLGQSPNYTVVPVAPRVLSDVMALLLRRAGERGQAAMLSGFQTDVKTIIKTEGGYSLKVEPVILAQRELPPVAYLNGYQRR